MFTWKKLGKVFTPQEVAGRRWLKEFAQAPATLVFDDFVRVYFSCRPPADANGQYVSYSAYVDLDRADLFKVRHVADTADPRVSAGWASSTSSAPIRSPSSATATKCAPITGAGRAANRCRSTWRSAWRPAATAARPSTSSATGPVLSYSPDEPFVLSGPKIRRFNDIWYLWYIAGRKWKVVDGRPEPVYKIRMASSADGIHWTKVNRDLIASRIEEDEAQASPDVFYANGKYHMFFCYRYSSHYRGKENGYRIGYASSTNLIDWVRDDAKAGIDVSEEGWDAEMVSYPHVFELDGKTYLAYLGNQVGRHGFGLAVLDGKLD